MNHLQRQREEFIQESREAGQRAFDVIFERLHYRNLHWMSQLDDDEHTWENLIVCTRTDPDDWDQDGRDYDRRLRPRFL